MKNPMMSLAAKAADAVVQKTAEENGSWWPPCFLWSYEPKKPASLMVEENNGVSETTEAG